jgi:pimeloyl-ACP methyl ester carboxylesterase
VRVDIGGGVRVFFEVFGPELVSDEAVMRPLPTLVLLHGGPGMDHSTYRPAFEQLTDIAHIIAYDHRGNGRSDGRDDPSTWTMDIWADDVRRFCDALGIDKPIVFGNSFGGMVAMHYAARHPEHPRALVLSSTATHTDVALVTSWFGRLGGLEAATAAEHFWTETTPANTAEYLRLCGPLYTQTPGNLFDDTRTIRNRPVLAHYVSEIKPTMDLRPDLAAIACPTLLLAGALDPVCPIEIMRELAAGIAPEHVHLEVFESCGHGVFRDDPERSFAVLRSFILDAGSLET